MSNLKNIKKILKEYDINPSVQRIEIYNYLIKNRIHPTVEEIYQNLVLTIPTLSKTTIYNTLKLFVEKDLVLELRIDNESRFDAFVAYHGHFKCNVCQKIYDFQVLENDDSLNNDLKNFKIEKKHTFYYGVCENCLNKGNEESI